ncbi:undecaprenyl-phosphate glucose phosphotransferase [Gallaecimonas mangrovi]|uniref:undecaprenyl-phosphate glucose phosphotransferase n=1 Tax=Gallaecimonas mangrovi TaxID=2291597 RepID=UPI000E202073|nr:undecaprenyl-phosphate glucose phosphotransferase [Gallaecimonas mangrovi]
MNRGFVKENQTFISIVHRCSDIFSIVVSFYIAKAIFAPKFVSIAYSFSLISSILIAFWLYSELGLYRTWRGESRVKEISVSFYAWTVNQTAVVGVFFIFGMANYIGKTFYTAWYLIGLFTFLFIRILIRSLLNHFRSQGYNVRQVIILGDGDVAQELACRIYKAPWTGYKILGNFGDEIIANTSRLGDFNDISSFLDKESSKIDQIWIALPLSDEHLVEQILVSLKNTTKTVRYIPDMKGFQLINHSVSEVAGLPVINLSMTPITGLNRFVKSLEDKILAFLILIMISPLMIFIGIGVKLSSPGPIFYRQERVSWNGKRFNMLKFRSMPVDTESTSIKWGSSKDKAVSNFGKFIRRTSLDELPQFINVLKGDMSIVGPRPERTIFVNQFKNEIPGYMQKHMVKAGITGWAQVNGWRGDTDLSKRVEYDLYYINNWSIWFDLKIVFLTIFKGFINKNAY